jgi:antitoxin component of MazEF toxin-antitoxin module
MHALSRPYVLGLHEDVALDAEVAGEREILVERRVRRNIAQIRDIRIDAGRTEYVKMAIAASRRGL